MEDTFARRVGVNVDTNNLEWDLILQPGKEISVPFTYSVTWPQGSELDNSNL